MPSTWQLASLFAVLPGVHADLPVHCLRHQYLGEWDFSLGPLSKHRSSCGHQRPDVEEDQPQGIDKATSTKRVTLVEPNIAKTANGSTGTFTLVYDEGFEVTIDGHVYFAFSKFDLAGKGNTNVSENAARSHCGETSRGWYRDMTRTSWGCYKATKVHQSISLIEDEVSRETRHFSPSYDLPRDLAWHKRRVRKLNLLQLSWTARVYDKFVGKTMRELNAYAGIIRPRSHQAPRKNALLEIAEENCPELPEQRRSKPGEVLSRLLLKGQKPLKPCQLKRQLRTFAQPVDPQVLLVEKSLPQTFDWRSARGGRNFLEAVADQSDCGSCYAVSTMRMLTARHRISTNNTQAEPWSISFPLHCSEYNQGCKGGYSYTVTKWSADVGLLPASCAPYNTTGSCQSNCDPKKLKKRYRVANHRVIGGFLGNSSAANMMLELYEKGPFVASFEPSDDFMMYSGGVFSETQLSPPAPIAAHGVEWQKTDHAVLVVGWGEEMGQKYWLAQNSWGADWGDGGYFKIIRDINDSGFETDAEGADVVEDDRPEVLNEFLEQLR